MEAKAVWKGDLTFVGSADSGFSLVMDTFKEVGGNESGFRPVELIAIGVAGCTGMDVISILKKKRQEVTAFEVLVHATRATEHPKKITHMLIEYVVTGKNIDPAAVERAVQLSEEKYCPSIATIRNNVTIENKIVIKEA
ncbi:predicted redox protein, regulator of disulfide bond formation [Bellilinea caldifistulae]|uniref:Osmotically inducible protein OsmC n=1 Tax=Bellilinea caldifistulae TaxID=360411 RepID=A0A0P6XNI9_9CHLR|nr:OsmC family protein [Bellilinea caldifistulae]KPL73611.1 osmotically inducible protein OsmC [Bellilinea caldifistulae]GAP10239.1 predicted redox protein, regulator of disulfide bond formation [Bellilinea caldifistulae]